MRPHPFKDLAIYVAISTLIIGTVAAIFYAGMSPDFFVRWIGLAIMTALVFGLFIQNSPTLRRERAFWFLFGLALLVHCAIWVAVLDHAEHWKFIWFYPMIIEMIPLQISRERLRKKLRQEHRKQHRRADTVH